MPSVLSAFGSVRSLSDSLLGESARATALRSRGSALTTSPRPRNSLPARISSSIARVPTTASQSGSGDVVDVNSLIGETRRRDSGLELLDSQFQRRDLDPRLLFHEFPLFVRQLDPNVLLFVGHAASDQWFRGCEAGGCGRACDRRRPFVPTGGRGVGPGLKY